MSSQTSNFYGYSPSMALAVIGAVLYAVAAGGTVFRFFQFQCWCFLVMVIAALGEAVGFSARAYSINHLTDVNAYIIGYLTVILAPSFMAAACYVVFGRVVWMVTPPHKRNFKTLWVPPRYITPIFVLFDLLSFFIQFIGIGAVAGALKSTNLSTQKQLDAINAGIATLKLGLIVQLLCFAIFALIGGRFMLVSRSWVVKGTESPSQWRKLGWALNIATTIIMLRAVFRVFEFSGNDPHANYLSTHEWPFWLFDALPMLMVLCIFLVFHPGMYLSDSFKQLKLDKKALARSQAETELPKLSSTLPNPMPPPYPQGQPQTYAQYYAQYHPQQQPRGFV